MLIATSTVKDTLAHVQRYVAGNLAGGVDHLVVFLDQPGAPEQEDVARFLDAHPHTTGVRAGPGWWGERRPAGLNERQCTNATVVAQLLAPASGSEQGAGAGADWVLHVDGDEIVRLDPAALAQVPQEVPAIRLVTREAVSRTHWEGEPTLFKRMLDEPELRLLHLLGAISEPTNRAYFHGHLQGKTGVRPSREVWLGLHKSLDEQGRATPAHEDERLELFHYESYSGEEFVRKWSAMVTSGPRASFRAGRAAVADACRTLVERDLAPDVRRALLLAVFERTTLDDATTLADLGVLLETDPLAGQHRPAPLSADTAQTLAEGLAALRGKDKSAFFKGAAPHAEAAPSKKGDDAGGPGRRRRPGRGGLLGRAT